MIEVGLVYQIDQRPTLLKALASLQFDLRIATFSLGENSRKFPFDEAVAGQYGQPSSPGLLLFGEKYDATVIVGRNDLRCVAHFEAAERGEQFLKLMADLSGPIFGYACDIEERRHKNWITVQIGLNKLQAWVGTDTNFWIPGLYWWTYISCALAERHSVAIDDFAGLANKISYAASGLFVNRHEGPDGWKSADIASEVAPAIAKKLFSSSAVYHDLKSATNVMEAKEVLAKWH